MSKQERVPIAKREEENIKEASKLGEIINEEIKKDILGEVDDAQIEMDSVLKEANVDPEVYMKTNNIFDKIRKIMLGNKMKKVVTFAAFTALRLGLLTPEASAGNDDNFDIDKDLNNQTGIETATQQNIDDGDGETVTGAFEENPDDKEDGNDNDTSDNKEVSKSHEKITKSFEATEFFEFAKATLSENQTEEMKIEFSNYIDSLTEEEIENLKNGTNTIVLHSDRSFEIINKETGVDSGRGQVYSNVELAEEAAKEAEEKVIRIVLREKGLDNVKIIYDIPEDGVGEDKDHRSVTISLKSTIEASGSDIEIDIDIEKVLENTYAVVVDPSKSMTADNAELEKNIHNVEEKSENEIKKIMLDTGFDRMHERHLKTGNKILDNIDEPFTETQYIIFYTDEPDADSEGRKIEYEKELNDFIERAKSKNMIPLLRAFDPENEGESIFKKLGSSDLSETGKFDDAKGWYKNLTSKIKS